MPLAAPAAAAATLIFAPSLSRSVPSMTTMSPAARPLAMTVFLPSLGPSVTLCTETVSSLLTR